MFELFEKLAVGVEADLTQLDAGLSRAQQKIRGVDQAAASATTQVGQAAAVATQEVMGAGEKMASLGSRLSSVGTAMSLAVSGPLTALGMKFTKTAMDAVESENLVAVTFGEYVDDIQKWSGELQATLGLSGVQLRKNAGMIFTMLKSMKLAPGPAKEMSKSISTLAYDMASFYNLDPEEAFAKLRSGLVGEIEPLRMLGINVNENVVKMKAWEMGIGDLTMENGKLKGTLTEQEKVQARYAAILDATSDAQGDLARTADSPANKLRIFQQRVEEFGMKIGNIIIPVLTKFMTFFQGMLSLLDKLPDSALQWIVGIGAALAAAGPLLLGLGQALTMLSTLFGTTGIGATVGSFAAFLTGPWGIAIAAVIAGVALVIANFGKIKKAVTDAYEAFKPAVEGFKEGFAGIGSGLSKEGGIKGWAQDTGFAIREFVKAISTGDTRSAVSGIADKFDILVKKVQVAASDQGLRGVARSLVAVQDGFRIFSKLIGAVTDVWAAFVGAVKRIDWGRLGQALVKLGDALMNIFGALWSAIRPIVVPVMNFIIELGRAVGMWLVDKIPLVVDAISGFVEWLTPFVNGIADFIDSSSESVGGFIDKVVAFFKPIGDFFAGIFGDAAKQVMDWWQDVAPDVMVIIDRLALGVRIAAGALKAFWKVASEAFKALWEAVGPYLMPLIAFLQGQFLVAFNVVKSVVGASFRIIGAVISAVITVVLGVLKGIIKFLKGDFKGAWEAVKESIIKAFSKLGERMKSIGGDLIDGIKKGLEAGKERIKRALRGVADKIPGWLKSFLGISSPSRVMAAIGRQMMDGLALGIEQGAGAARSALSGVYGELGALSPAIAGAGGTTRPTSITYGDTNISIEAKIASDMDIEYVAERLNRLVEAKRRAAGER
jgi:phage-related protein